METAVDKKAAAWQPLTARGVAAFSRARWGRLLVVQFMAALLAAAAVVWFLRHAWFPIIHAAILQMPAEGEIRGGHLNWPAESPVTLAEGRCLAVAVDADHKGAARSPAHVEIEFGRNDVRIFSLFGFVQFHYPLKWRLPFDRPELEPWWGAWRPSLLAVVVALVLGGLMLSWTV